MKTLGNLEIIIKNKLNKLYKENIPKNILERYNAEIKIIHKKKLENNYLIAYKIVEKAKQDNRIIIDRISGSSYIDYLLGMTVVNPLKYELSNDMREDMTFYCGIAEDYFEIMYDYLKSIFEKYKLSNKFDNEELKKYGIRLEINSYAHKLERLERETKIKSQSINLNNLNVYNYLNNKLFFLDKNDSKKQLFTILNPKSINELADIYSLIHSNLDINYSDLYNYDLKKFPYTRDNIYIYLLKHNVKRKDAYMITKFIYKGNTKRNSNTWKIYTKYLIKHNIEQKYIETLEKINYLWPKSICITRAIIIYWLSYYQLYYRKEYYKIMSS